MAEPWFANARKHGAKVAVAGLGVLAMVAIAIPLASTRATTASDEEAAQGDLTAALAEARDAVALQPYAASPRLQEALILERQGDISGALSAAREATSRESTNWRTWFIVSRLEAQSGNPRAAFEAFRRARSLNPESKSLQLGQLSQ